MSLASQLKQHHQYDKVNIDKTNSTCKILFRVKFGHKLTFDDHISELCKITTRKKSCISKSNTISESFYCFFIEFFILWMHYSRANNSKIKRLHERYLRIYLDKQSSYEVFLETGGFVSVHNRNFQILATEMDKVKASHFQL